MFMHACFTIFYSIHTIFGATFTGDCCSALLVHVHCGQWVGRAACRMKYITPMSAIMHAIIAMQKNTHRVTVIKNSRS